MRPSSKVLILLLPITSLILSAAACGKKPKRISTITSPIPRGAEGSDELGNQGDNPAENQGENSSGDQDKGPVQETPVWNIKNESYTSALFLNTDLRAPGPLGSEPTTLEYALPAARDTEVRTDGTLVDVRGIVYLPSSTDAAATFPVIIIFTGNHASCGVLPANSDDPRVDNATMRGNGQCPRGTVEAPSHKGYEYLAKTLTSWGYAVISINPNRGIQDQDGIDSDPSLIRARAALLRKHIGYLSTEFELASSLDFKQLGLLGHSRGGDTVRTFYNLYKEPEVFQVQAVYEIAPIDSGSGTPYDVVGAAWGLLLGGCDGDVSNFEGINPYRRVLSAGKGDSLNSVITLAGANHNFFNSEWQTSDARICEGDQKELWDFEAELSPEGEALEELAFKGIKGSEEQRTLAEAFVTAFFRANLGSQKDEALNRVFDPSYALPAAISAIAPVAREFVDYRSQKLLTLTSTEGNVGKDAREIDETIGKKIVRLLSQLTWGNPSSELYYQANMWKDGEDLSRFSAINIPVSRRERVCDLERDQEDCPISEATSFGIQLVDVAGNLSEPFSSEKFIKIRNLINRPDDDGFIIRLLFDTISLPTQVMAGQLKDTQGDVFDMTRVKGVRLTFNEGEAATVFASKTWTAESKAVEYPKGDSTLALLDGKPGAKVAEPAPKRPGIDSATWRKLKEKRPASRRP